MKITKFKAWEKTCCDHCGGEFQVSRCDPKKVYGDVICGDCEIYKSAYSDGYKDGFAAAIQSKSNE